MQEAEPSEETHLIFDCKSWKQTSYKVIDYNTKQVVENDHSDDRHDILSKVMVEFDDISNVFKFKFSQHYFTHFSGFGSTLKITKNFREGLAKVVDYLKMTLNKERISILGK